MSTCWRLCISTPDCWPWKIIWIIVTENNMRDHSIFPLRVKQSSNFQPCTPLIKMPYTQCSKNGVPIPLIWIKSICGNRIASTVIHLNNFDCFLDSFCHQFSFLRSLLSVQTLRISRTKEKGTIPELSR